MVSKDSAIRRKRLVIAFVAMAAERPPHIVGDKAGRSQFSAKPIDIVGK